MKKFTYWELINEESYTNMYMGGLIIRNFRYWELLEPQGEIRNFTY